MAWKFALLMFLAGSFLPLQAGVNSLLGQTANNTVFAALISFTVGTLGLLGYFLLTRQTWPQFSSLSTAPWWAWTGGLMGAFFIAMSVIAAPKLGATAMIASIVGGQIIASLFYDHYSIANFPLHEINIWRLVGAFFIIIGVIIVNKF